MISKLRLVVASAFAITPALVLHCGGGSAQGTTNTAPTSSAPPSASTAAASSSAATTAAAIQCPVPKPAAPPPATSAKAGCPDMSTLDAVAKLDFAKELKVDSKLGGQLKDITEAEVALADVEKRIEGSMKDACTKLLGDFGCTGGFGGGRMTCDAAADVLEQAKKRVGSGATMTAHNTPPHCTIATQPELDCLHKCDPTFKGKAAALKCDGTADPTAGCDGSWTAPASAGCVVACAAEVMSQAQCTPTQVSLTIDNAADAKAADMLKSAVEKDLHGALLLDAAHGRFDGINKKFAEMMKTLPPNLDDLEKKNPRLGCFDATTMQSTLTLTDIATLSVLSVRLLASGTMQKPH